MKIDDTLLLKYVEHQLDEATAKTLEQRLEQDPAMQRKVLALKASRLPYEAAFAAADTAPMPEQLRERLEQLAQVAQPVSTQAKTGVFLGRGAIAVCFLMAFTLGVLLTSAVNLWTASQPEFAHSDTSSLAFDAYGSKALVDAMIQYQALYTRETVAKVNQPMVEASALVDNFNQHGGYQLSIPDLSAQGYEFRRIQTLAYEGQIILQLVYLPEDGLPLALCVTPALAMSAQPMDYRYAGMNSLLWVDGGLGYMLMGQINEQRLEEVLQAIEPDYPVT